MHKHGLEIQEIKAVPGSSESNLPVLIDTKQGETFISSLISLAGRNESCEKRHFLLLRRGRQAALRGDKVTQVGVHCWQSWFLPN